MPLAVFPVGGLSQSVITCVWVGVFVVVFFNLRFGWVLSGLVVPGYLAPLLLVKPVAAVIVIGESIVTFGLVYLFSERASRLGWWPNLFGRDRFFALLLVSVLVRVAFDGYLLPDLADWLDATKTPKRQSAIWLRSPQHVRFSETLELPTGFALVGQALDHRTTNAMGSVRATLRQERDRLRFDEDIRVNQRNIAAKDYAALKAVADAVRSVGESQVYLERAEAARSGGSR